jgi:hypothetical protein
MPSKKTAPEPGEFRRYYRIFIWASLGLLILCLVLILNPSSPPRIIVTPQAAQRAQTKVHEFLISAEQGREKSLEMDEPELNGWLNDNLALQRPAESSPLSSGIGGVTPISLAKQALAPATNAEPSMEQVASAVRDVKIELRENSLRAYVAFDLYGKDLSLELEGRVTLQRGCLRLEPTAGKLGSMPLLAGTLQAAANRLFNAPENREKFRVPFYIHDVRIAGGRLIFSTR